MSDDASPEMSVDKREQDYKKPNWLPIVLTIEGKQSKSVM
ncbi:hypothetical protein MWLp12_2218 [Lactiplantibacillus plantarum]|nr:hypothetical protein Nizo2814_0167 [Lactiplantibacillus plantarum]WCL69573.1 hypothetical protein MWLp12_2218 [Lactiplantibacillus plantarum]